ncbi:hypothetical protein GGR50DRAFT_684368 [Xylaria sp. CBS 124048]|nr:hypothetical protein GGR50DRAFT_684368 [Xylaria sp. CBS 124048]
MKEKKRILQWKTGGGRLRLRLRLLTISIICLLVVTSIPYLPAWLPINSFGSSMLLFLSTPAPFLVSLARGRYY